MKNKTVKFDILGHGLSDGDATTIELAFSSKTKADLVTNILKAEAESRLLYHAEWYPCEEDPDTCYLQLQIFNEEEEVINTVSSRTPWEHLDKKTVDLAPSSREHMKERKSRERRLLKRAIRQNPIAMKKLLNSMENLIIDEMENRLKKMSDKELEEMLDLEEFNPDEIKRRK